MYDFNYHSPNNINEALDIFSSSEDPKFLAGGMTLVASMKQRLISPTDLIDLKLLNELNTISLDGNRIILGALCTHDQISKNKEIKSKINGFSNLASGIGDPAVRIMGTIGGSLANSDPAADWPSAILALRSNLKTNNRTINNDDFFTGMFETSLEDNEILTSIEYEIPEYFKYVKFPNPASRYAVVGVSIAKYDNEVRVAVTGASHKPFIAKEISESLSKDFSTNFPLKTIPKSELNEDIHASSEYRQNLIDVCTKHALMPN